MTYISPFHLLGLGTDAALDKSTLNLAKKKILAELELSSSQTIVLAEQEMTKNDVLQFFDVLGKTKNLEYHQAIAQDSALLSFLEKGTIEEYASFLQQAIYNDSDFIEFVSPYFSEKYSAAIIKALRESNNKHLRQYLSLNPILLSPSDKYDTWGQVESFLTGEIKEIDTTTEQVETIGVKIREEIMHFYDYQFLACLNHLPEDFASTRDRYARALYSLATVQWNNNAHQNAAEIVKEAMLLNTYPETKTILKDRTAWFKEQLNGLNSSTSQTEEGSDVGGALKIFFYILIFVFNLARIGKSCNTSPKHSSFYSNASREVTMEQIKHIVEERSMIEEKSIIEGRDVVTLYLADEKEKLNQLYATDNKDKATIRQLANKQADLYLNAKGIMKKKGN